jgi:hypothetical protein
MKTEKKQVYLKPYEVELVRPSGEGGDWKYTFTLDKFIDVHNMEHFIEVDVPENMGEFRKLHCVASKDLLEWLNKNYK